MVELAPVRFSTTTGWPHASASFAAIRRANASEPPPADAPTRMRDARDGKFCACAVPTSATSNTAMSLTICLLLVELLCARSEARLDDFQDAALRDDVADQRAVRLERLLRLERHVA